MRDVIRGRAATALRLLRRDDRGVIGLLVGLLIGTVLVGVGALSIDIGQLYSQRAQLQGGADAAAIAVAKSCVVGTCTSSTALVTAKTYAGENAKGGVAGVTLVCGSGSLGACPASSGLMTDCPPAPPAGTNYVDVHTSTLTSGGATVVSPVFGRALLGNGNYTGTTVLACSQAEWGGPTTANVTSFAISACEWDQATSQGAVYATPGHPAYNTDVTLQERSGDDESGCSSETEGSDSPGQFGWANDSNGTCSLNVNSGTFGGNPGASASQACKSALSTDYSSGSTVYVPVYTKCSGGGENSTYSLKGFAAFVVTGYHLPGATAYDSLNPNDNCSGSGKCINGYFTQGVISYTSPLTSTYLGAATVKLTG